MSAAHEGKFMKESSLQTQSRISHPSQQRTCMQCMAYEHAGMDLAEEGSNSHQSGITLPNLVHG